MDCSPQAPLNPRGFSRQEYWSRLPCPHPGDLPIPGIKPRSPTFQVDSLLTEPSEKPVIFARGVDIKNLYIYTMEYYSAIKKDCI